ncbi:MAG: TonB-dependent receptor plug domain-containing protein [Bacteroidota bacterium]
MNRLYLLLFLLLTFTTFTRAQKIKVISSGNGQPIENVTIYNTGMDRSTLTDSLGFSGKLPFIEGDTVIFRHPAYLTLSFPWKELAGKKVISLVMKKVQIEEYVISATKSRDLSANIPYTVALLDSIRLIRSDAPSAADILEETGEVSIQRTQGGGGSPVLRGFEANRVLLVIDGVRMNNAIYRSGHLQNAITIDPSILERTEVIFGPVSTMYGSDALGGVIHYYTRDPQLAGENRHSEEVNGYLRYSTASSGYTGHLDFSLSGERWASLTSLTYKNLGDIRMGSVRNPYYGDWGKVLHYVIRENGIDTMIANPDPLLQKNTAYSQSDFMQKIRFSPNGKSDWILNLQYSTSSDIDRLDMLNNYSGDILQYAEYYYGPQNRLLGSLKYVSRDSCALYSTATTILAVQKIDEDRITRKFRNDEMMVQNEDVMVYSLTSDLQKDFSSLAKLNYGLDMAFNTVASTAWYEDIQTWEQRPAETRYPNLGSKTWTGALYGNLQYKTGEKMILAAGARYSRNYLYSRFDYPFLPFDEVKINNGALTGSLSMVWHPAPSWQINTILSSGFRNPNVDDYGKIRAKNGEATVPNNTVGPEYSYNAEAGIRKSWGKASRFDVVAYYTFLADAIVRTDYQLNGSDSIMYDGDYYKTVTNSNAAKAYIYGVTANLRAELSGKLFLSSAVNYTRGHNITDNIPMGHIPPVYGRTALTWEDGRFRAEGWLAYSAWKHIEDFNPFDEDNTEEATPYGFPSWWTANIRLSCQLGRYSSLQFAVENIFDQFYKTFASGVCAPGRNFIVTLRTGI